MIHNYPKVTYSDPKMTYSDPKVTYSEPKVTYSDQAIWISVSWSENVTIYQTKWVCL